MEPSTIAAIAKAELIDAIEKISQKINQQSADLEVEEEMETIYYQACSQYGL